MVSKCTRIPTRMIFVPGYQYKDEFMTALERTMMFSIICSKDEYQKMINELILVDEDPSDYIISHEPMLEGMNPLTICVSSEMIDTLDMPFIYTPDLMEAEFMARANEIVDGIKIKYVGILRGNQGINFYKRYLGDTNQKKELAMGHFLLCEYQNALGYYNSIKKVYPAYACRMAEWCKLLLNRTNARDTEYYDILLLHKRADLLYGIAMLLEADMRMGIEYWLSKHALPRGALLLVEYRCFINFLRLGDYHKTRLYLERMKEEIKRKRNAGKCANNTFWEDILRELLEKKLPRIKS